MSTASGFHFSLPLDCQVGPASRISRTRAAQIVAKVMTEGAPSPSRVDIKIPSRGRPWRKVALLTAAAIILPVTMVAAGSRLVATRRAASAAALLMTAPAAPTDGKRAPAATQVAAAAAPASVPSVEAPAAAPVPLSLEPRRARRTTGGNQPSTVGQTPQDMLQKANDLRGQHRWFAATQLYEQTLRTFPDRAEAYSATVAAGMLRLDQLGDARGALDLFSSAIRARPHGTLSEEARWGVVQSYRALGDHASEKARLEEFVALFPQSLLASRAQERLRELGGMPSTL